MPEIYNSADIFISLAHYEAAGRTIKEAGACEVPAIGSNSGGTIERIINKKTGTVTLFGFDEGEGLSEHTAPFDALVYLLEGEAEVIISGKSVFLKKGEMTIMPAKEPHSLNAIKRFKMLLVLIKD